MQKKILALVVVLTMFIFSTTAFADYARVADNTVPAYTDAALTQRIGNERVDKGDRVTVHQETGNAYRVTYPTPNGSKTRWVPKNIFNAAPTSQPVSRYRTISDGWYKISSMKAPYRVLDVAGAATNVGANIQLWDWANVNQQKFKVTNVGNGYFTLTAGNCGLNISAANDSRQFRTNVQLASPNSNDAKQQWRLVTTGQDGNKIFYIESRLQEKLALDCQDTSNANGTNIWLWEYGNVDWDKWKFESVSAPPDPQPQPSVPANLQNLINTYNNKTWRNHTYLPEVKECKEFASFIFNQLYGVGYIGGGSTSSNPKNYLINLTNPGRVGLRGYKTNLTAQSARELFQMAQPGDFVQIRRRHGGPHSGIFVSRTDNGIVLFEANEDGKNSIRTNSYSYNDLANRNEAMSLYYAK